VHLPPDQGEAFGKYCSEYCKEKGQQTELPCTRDCHESKGVARAPAANRPSRLAAFGRHFWFAWNPTQGEVWPTMLPICAVIAPLEFQFSNLNA
jgi:hypothetical protein